MPSARAKRLVEPVPPAAEDELPMTADQAKVLKQLAENCFELDAYDPNLTREDVEWRIAALKAKLKLLDEPPHSL